MFKFLEMERDYEWKCEKREQWRRRKKVKKVSKN